MESISPQLIYLPSGRKVLALSVFLLLFSLICFKKSHTYDEVAHKMCLVGACVFVLAATYFATQFFRGMPRLTLTRDGLIWATGLATRLLPWSTYEGFHVGHAFGPIETIRFFRSDTGTDGAIINTTKISTDALCAELTRWRDKYAPANSRDA
jgi:hypothetical protein